MISKKVWESPDLWEGFIRCCKMSRPYSMKVLCDLPQVQLQQILKENEDLIPEISEYSKDTKYRKHIKEA
eukprot:UN04053